MILIKLSFPTYKQVFCIFLLFIIQFLEFHLVLGFFFLYYFLCSSNLSSFSLYLIVFLCFYRSRSRSFFYIFYLFYFIISFGSTFLSSQLNKYKRKLHFFYLLTCLSLFPFFILLFFHPSNQTDLLH